eukprot:m.185461 g.185461  ORF g.185461 m.185461 type:complete len:68 (-) comp13605_c1_seq7:48-251(-)
MDLNACNGFDSSALHALHLILHDAEHKGITILVANMKGPVRDVFLRVGIIDESEFKKSVILVIISCT